MKNKELIMKALGVEGLESDSHGGVYLAASLVDALGESLASMEHLADTLEAKGKEIESLNEMIKNLKATHAEELATKEAEIAELNTKLETAKVEAEEAKENDVEELKTAHAEELAAKDAEIAELNTKLEAANQTIAEKEAEIDEMAQTTQQAPTPASAPQSNATSGAKEETFHVESVVKAGMSTKEKQEALKARMAYLRANRG